MKTLGLGLTLLLVAGCAQLKASQGSPGKISSDSFTPERAPSEMFGPNPVFECRSPGLIRLLLNDLAEQRPAGALPVVADGQLCAAAESLLGWEKPETLSANVVDFVAWHFGLPSPPKPRAVILNLPTEELAEMAPLLNEVLGAFAKKATQPRFGVATLRLGKKSTKVVLFMQEVLTEFAPVPQHLALAAVAPLKGRVLSKGTGQVLVSDAQGRLEQSPIAPGGEFHADLHCGDKPGRIQVEVRSDQDGQNRTVLGFPVQCGAPVPLALALPVAGQWPAQLAEHGKKVLEQINAERVAVGLAPLQWEEALAAVARTVAEGLRDDSLKGGVTTPLDPLPLLQKAELMSPLVLVNPGQALTTEDAQREFSMSPPLRANFMNPEVTHVGIGVVQGKDPGERSSVFVVELFIRQLTALDPVAVQRDLSQRIVDKRLAAHLPAFAKDPSLEAAATQYAAALAASGGTLSNEKSNAFLTPLYKTFLSVNVLSGVRLDPLTIADESAVTGKGQRVGVGVAQGVHPAFGKNAVYAVVLIGVHR